MTRIPQSTAKGHEKAVVHPAVAEWLTFQNYTWQYEYDTGDGFIDFLASHPQLGSLIVECKSDCKSIQTTIMQVLYYSRLLKDQCACAIAVPSHTVNQATIDKLERLGIMLITVDVIDKKGFISGKDEPLSGMAMAFMMSIYIGPIKHFHKTNNTSPVKDYYELLSVMSPIKPPEFREFVIHNLARFITDDVFSDERTGDGDSWFDSDRTDWILMVAGMLR